jgi:hypothetical protein
MATDIGWSNLTTISLGSPGVVVLSISNGSDTASSSNFMFVFMEEPF